MTSIDRVVNNVVASLSGLQRASQKATTEVPTGNKLMFDSDTDSLDVVKLDGVLEAIAHKVKMAELASGQKDKVGSELETMYNISQSIAQLAHYTAAGVNVDPTTAREAGAQAMGILETISQFLSAEFVDKASITDVSNVLLDGSTNTNYVVKTRTNEMIKLANGVELPDHVIPEKFKDLIGAMHAIIRDSRAGQLPGNRLSADSVDLFTKGNAALSEMLVIAKTNHSAAEHSSSTLLKEIGIDEDTRDSIQKTDYNKLAAVLSEHKTQSKVMQGIMAMLYKVQSDTINTAIAAASAA